MRPTRLPQIFVCFYVSSQVGWATRIQASRLPSGPTKVVEGPSGDATTTYFIQASKDSHNPVGALTSIVDTFVGQGTTTEYMTQHIGTHIDNTYAKIQTTSSREYYRIKPTASPGYDTPIRPTGLIGSSTSLEVNGPASTFFTVEEYRTYVDGHYAHLVSSISNVVTDPAYITPTPIFSHGGLNSELAADEHELRKSLYSSYEQVKPSRAHKFGGVVTRTVGQRVPREFENEIESDLYAVNSGRQDGGFAGTSHKVPRQIDQDAVESETFEVKIEPAKPQTVARPTYTVGENGEINFPAPKIEAVSPEPAVEPSQQHRFGGNAKPSKTVLDTVTYRGFVDFTTTIDDTVVIFKPKQTSPDNSRGLVRPQIVPTRSHSFNPHSQSSAPSRQNSPRKIEFDTAPKLDSSSIPEEERSTLDRIEKENKISDEDIKKHTSGIDALKSLLSSRSRAPSRGFRPQTEAPQQTSSAQQSSSSSSSRNAIFNRPRPSASVRHSGIVTTALPEDFTTDPSIDIIASIDPTSDVELVFKTLYTTYTYFTTFFRESTTRVKSREDVISNVLTLTNILKSSDLPSISSSCQLDSSCLFRSTDVLNPADFSDGFFGRPNSRLEEEPRTSGEGRPAGDEILSPSGLGNDVNAVLRTFYTTYTYFSTLFEGGTSRVSTRTEVYSNEQTAVLPVSIINDNSVSILPASIINTAPTKDSGRSVFPLRRLEVSSVRPVNLQSELTTPQSREEEERTSNERLVRPTTERTPEEEEDEATTQWIQPTPIYTTIGEDREEDEQVITQETPALTEEVTEVITSATTESEEALDPEAVTEFVPRTLYTTFTYFTTLFKEGDIIVNSNMKTVTSVMTDAFVQPTTVEPSVTFFTTFTYWTTSVDNEDKTVVTSHEETITDILPASVHQNGGAESTEGADISPSTGDNEVVIESTIAPSLGAEPSVFTFYTTHYDGENPIVDTILSTVGPLSTQVPEIQSGEVEVISSSAVETPESTIRPTASFQEIDNDFSLTGESEDEDEEGGVRPTRTRGRVSLTRPGNTFTPVIRPLLRSPKKPGSLFRTTNQRVSTTVATRTRNSVKPTLIATPASSAPQPTPSFGSSSRPGFLASSSLFNRGQSRFSSSAAFSISGSSSIAPSAVASRDSGSSSSVAPTTEASRVVISPLGFRRPNPFRARLKEKQLERLASLRNKRPNRVRTSAPKSPKEDATISIPNIPSPPGGNAPIFVSAQRQFVKPNRREPKKDISVPKEVADRRERARQRIKTLFSRKRPAALGRPSLVNDESSDIEEKTRRKRQVRSATFAEFGSRTQARQSYVHNRRSANPRSNPQSYFLDQDNPPFTAFHHTQPTSTSQTQSLIDYYYEDDTSNDFYDSSPAQTPSSRHNAGFRRQAALDVPDPTTRATPLRSRSRSRARLTSTPARTTSPPTSRSRTVPLRTRSRFNFRTATTTTTTPTPRRNFRPRPRSFGTSSRNRFTPARESSRDSSRNSRFGSSLSSKNSFSRGKVVDYSDYDYDYDYEDTQLQSSKNDVPDFITVTHMVPFATQIPIVKFGRTEHRDILSTSPSLEVVAVTALKSTDINESPIIFANAHTLTPQPGVQEIFFDALRATETTSVTFTPTRIRGRKTSFSHAIPTTIYNVETVSTQIIEPVDQNQLLNSLLQQLLLGQSGSQQSPNRPNQLGQFGNQPALPSTPVTNIVTHTSTYVTTITEEESTVIPITFRGKEITTTLVESSTKVITATEFSTETQVTAAAVRPTNVLQQIAATQAPRIDVNPLANNPQLASLLPALLGVQQANLFNQQSEAALLQKQLQEQQQNQLLRAQQQQQQQQLQDQLLAAQLAEQQQQLTLDELDQLEHDAFNEELLARLNLDDFSDEDLANLDIEAVVDAVTRQQNNQQNSQPLVFPKKNLFGTLPLNPTPEEKPEPDSPRSSVITIFKSGSSPGDFTKVLSTVFLTERRKRSVPVIAPSLVQTVAVTEAPSLDPGFLPRGEVHAPLPSASRLTNPLDLIQSGIVSETETQLVNPTISLPSYSQHP